MLRNMTEQAVGMDEMAVEANRETLRMPLTGIAAAVVLGSVLWSVIAWSLWSILAW